MFSMTGYFFLGSKFDGRMMTPQMSVLPSRPLATKTSGAFHPAARSAEMSAFSSVATKRTVARAAELRDVRQIHSRVRVDEVLHVWRETHVVARVGVGQRGEVRTVEIDPIEVREVRILARIHAARAEPDLPLVVVDLDDARGPPTPLS